MPGGQNIYSIPACRDNILKDREGSALSIKRAGCKLYKEQRGRYLDFTQKKIAKLFLVNSQAITTQNKLTDIT